MPPSGSERPASTPTAPIIRQSATDFAEILGCRRVLLVLVDGGARVVRMPAEGRQGERGFRGIQGVKVLSDCMRGSFCPQGS